MSLHVKEFNIVGVCSQQQASKLRTVRVRAVSESRQTPTRPLDRRSFLRLGFQTAGAVGVLSTLPGPSLAEETEEIAEVAKEVAAPESVITEPEPTPEVKLVADEPEEVAEPSPEVKLVSDEPEPEPTPEVTQAAVETEEVAEKESPAAEPEVVAEPEPAPEAPMSVADEIEEIAEKEIPELEADIEKLDVTPEAKQALETELEEIEVEIAVAEEDVTKGEPVEKVEEEVNIILQQIRAFKALLGL